MTEETQNTAAPTYSHRVVRGAIRKPGGRGGFTRRDHFIHQGELIPDGMFRERELASWLADGRIARVSASAEEVEQARSSINRHPVWTVDPSRLVGKSMADLLLLVAEIDPSYDTDQLEDEAAAVSLLTSEWDPKYAQVTPAANDRSKPPVLNLRDLEQTETETATRSSNPGSDALERARAKAQAPQAEQE